MKITKTQSGNVEEFLFFLLDERHYTKIQYNLENEAKQ